MIVSFALGSALGLGLFALGFRAGTRRARQYREDIFDTHQKLEQMGGLTDDAHHALCESMAGTVDASNLDVTAGGER